MIPYYRDPRGRSMDVTIPDVDLNPEFKHIVGQIEPFSIVSDHPAHVQTVCDSASPRGKCIREPRPPRVATPPRENTDGEPLLDTQQRVNEAIACTKVVETGHDVKEVTGSTFYDAIETAQNRASVACTHSTDAQPQMANALEASIGTNDNTAAHPSGTQRASPHTKPRAGVALPAPSGDSDDVPEETNFPVWPGVIMTKSSASDMPPVDSTPPAQWVYFNRSQLARYFSDRHKDGCEKITGIRTLTVVGDHSLMLGHLGIHLPANDEEDMEEIVFGTALDTCSPLFLLPYATFGYYLGAQVVFCDGVRGMLTPERCAVFEKMRQTYGECVWAMCGVASVREAETSAVLTLNEYASHAMCQYYQTRMSLDGPPECIDAEDRRELKLLLQVAPALQVSNEIICPDTFVYFLLNYNGTKALTDVLSDFKLRKVGKCRRKALDCVEDPLAALRVFDSEMGQSEESITYRVDLLREVLLRAKEDMQCTRASREEQNMRMEVTLQRESNERLCAELEESHKTLGKWKSYAEQLQLELAATQRSLAKETKAEPELALCDASIASLPILPIGQQEFIPESKPVAHLTEQETLQVHTAGIQAMPLNAPQVNPEKQEVLHSGIPSLSVTDGSELHHYSAQPLPKGAACCVIQ